MSVDLVFRKKYTKLDGQDIVLPNSVSIDNDRIVVTDSGNNRVCVVDNEREYSIGGEFGLGKYKFKEPVYSTIFQDMVFSCDWQNHRIVIYKGGKFERQIGLFGVVNKSKISNFLRLLRTFKLNGSFDSSHFSKKNVKSDPSVFALLKNIVECAVFYVFNPGILVKNTFDEVYVNKPNGCVIVNEILYFTQKDNHCVTAYDMKTQSVIKSADNMNSKFFFGRLGQIAEFNGRLYVCDETNNKVWVLSLSLDFIESISITKYNIFSISINKKYIAACGECSFSLFDHAYNELYESSGGGEYHGVCLNDKDYYLVNRLMHSVEKYTIQDGRVL